MDIGPDEKGAESRLFRTRLAIGAGQGLGLYLLYRTLELSVWPAPHGLVFAPLLLTFLYVPPLLNLALGAMAPRGALVWAGAATALLAALGALDIWMGGPAAGVIPSAALLFFAAAGLFIGHVLVIGHVPVIGAAERPFTARYAVHFDTAWTLAVQLVLAGLFTGLLWLLLWLGSALFTLIKLNFLERLIAHDWFWIPVTCVAVAGALHLTGSRAGLVLGARTLLLTLLSWLLPLIVLIAAGFIASLPFTGLTVLWQTGHAAGLLLAASAALILLLNAAYQDGAPERHPPPLLRGAATAAALLVLPLAVIAAHALWLRVNQHGWSTERVSAAAITCVALAYGLGYAKAGLTGLTARGHWLAGIERWNFGVSLLILILLLLLFTPLASPSRIAVADQMARLAAHRVAPDKFDYAFLRRDGGRYGHAALAALAQSPDPAIRAAARRAQTAPTPGKPARLETRITVHPAGHHLPDSFLKQKWDAAAQPYLPACLKAGYTGCDAMRADMDGDGRDEIMLWQFANLAVFAETGGQWRMVARADLPCGVTLSAVLEKGRFTLAPPEHRWQDIVIGPLRIALTAPPPPAAACPAPR